MNRTLAMDYGQKRIGLAVSDPLGLTAQSLPFLENKPNVFTNLNKICQEYEVTKIIIGLPKNLHGQDSPMAGAVRAFVKNMAKQIPVSIEYWDERYSSQAAERHLISAGVSRKKRKGVIDSQAAVFILQGYLDSRAIALK